MESAVIYTLLVVMTIVVLSLAAIMIIVNLKATNKNDIIQQTPLTFTIKGGQPIRFRGINKFQPEAGKLRVKVEPHHIIFIPGMNDGGTEKGAIIDFPDFEWHCDMHMLKYIHSEIGKIIK